MGYKLPQDLRKSLRDPIGQLFSGDHETSAKKAIEYIYNNKKGLVVAVGDLCAKSLLDQEFYPDLIIYDEKTQRNDRIHLDLTQYEIRIANNPREWILRSTWEIIENAIAFSTSNKCRIAVRIDGEEDLLIIPVIISLPLGSIVTYGQPPINTEEGLVVALITPTLKNKIYDILSKFEFHEED